jgi:hypothetical protein
VAAAAFKASCWSSPWSVLGISYHFDPVRRSDLYNANAAPALTTHPPNLRAVHYAAQSSCSRDPLYTLAGCACLRLT